MNRVGVVGAGFIAVEHLKRWRHLGVELHLQGGARAEALGEQYGATVHSSLASLIDAVDVVDICTPTPTHAEIAIFAARAERHVISEKPLADSLASAAQAMEACEARGVRLFVGHVVRYFPEYSAVHDAVIAGKTGEPAVLRLARESAPPERDGTDWIFDEAKSGGVIGDLMIHDIDFARWIAGDVVRVHARTVSTRDDDVADHAFVILTHENGAISHLVASWAMTAPMFRTRVEVVGATGMLEYDSSSTVPVQIYRREQAQDADASGLPDLFDDLSDEDPFVLQFRDFLNAIDTGEPTRATPNDAIEALRISLAAVESAGTGRAVVIKRGLI